MSERLRTRWPDWAAGLPVAISGISGAARPAALCLKAPTGWGPGVGLLVTVIPCSRALIRAWAATTPRTRAQRPLLYLASLFSRRARTAAATTGDSGPRVLLSNGIGTTQEILRCSRSTGGAQSCGRYRLCVGEGDGRGTTQRRTRRVERRRFAGARAGHARAGGPRSYKWWSPRRRMDFRAGAFWARRIASWGRRHAGSSSSSIARWSRRRTSMGQPAWPILDRAATATTADRSATTADRSTTTADRSAAPAEEEA